MARSLAPSPSSFSFVFSKGIDIYQVDVNDLSEFNLLTSRGPEMKHGQQAMGQANPGCIDGLCDGLAASAR